MLLTVFFLVEYRHSQFSPTLLRLWMSILDGESQVERDLGCMIAFYKSGQGLCNEDLILKLCGPQTGEEAGGTFAVQCVELWRKHIGARKLCQRRARGS